MSTHNTKTTIKLFWVVCLGIISGLIITKPLNAQPIAPQAAEDSPAIIGGREAEPDAWPWQAALVRSSRENAYTGQFCGGSLVAPEWVLTAAHCVDDDLSASEVDVVLGRHRLSSDEGERIAVDDIIIHRSKGVSLAYDIALLHLAEPSQQTPVALYKDTEPVEANFVSATVVGWGQQETGYWGNKSDVLHEVMVPIADHKDCGAGWERYLNYDVWLDDPEIIIESMICTGFEKLGRDSCYGDSGGPLMIRRGADQPWLQVGIVSFGAPGCSSSSLYEVYTRVSSFVEWIEGCTSNLDSRACTGGDQFEPDDSYMDATLIASDAISQTHSFHKDTDQDWFRFEAQAGKTYHIQTHHTGARTDPLLWLYDSDGVNTLLYDDDSGGGRSALIRWVAPRSGTYYFSVEDYLDATGEESGYGVSVEEIVQEIYLPIIADSASASTYSVDGYYEPNDSRSETTFISTDSQAQVHSFLGGSDIDWLRFEGVAGTRYTVETPNICSGCDTYLYAYEGDSSDYFAYNDDGGPGLGSLIRWVAESNSTFYIKIGRYSGYAEGTYEVRVSATSLSDTATSYAALLEQVYR